MKKITAFLLSVILIFGILLTSCADSTVDTPIADTTVAEETPDNTDGKERKIYKHVLVICSESAGAFFRDADTPNIDRFFSDGSVTYTARADSPALTETCFMSMLHGAKYSEHKIFEGNGTAYPADSEFPSVFRAVLEQAPDARVTVIADKFFTVDSTEDGIGIEKIEANGDFRVAETICEYLNENSAPTLLFTAFTDCYSVAADDGWGTVGHLSALRNEDMFIGIILDKYEEQGILDDTLVIVTANSGGYEHDQGGNSDSEKYVMFAVAGESVIKNGEPRDMEIRDVPAVIMYALGLECPENWTARLPAGIFDGVGEEERGEYVSADNARYRQSLPTPGSDSEGYVTNYITDKALKYYLTFDGTTEDSCGSKVEAVDDYYYIDGIFGEGIRLDNGYLTLPDYSNGGEAFTLAMWLKVESAFSDTAVITNRNRTDQKNSGFTLSVTDLTGKNKTPSLVLTTGNGEKSDMRPFKLPSDHLDGWVHLIFAYNPEEGKARISFDFGEFKEIVLRDGMTDVFDNGILCIGHEPVGESPYNYNFDGGIDELMQFDGYFTEDDVAALVEYYKK
ncbi:MAG: hypothetical protein IKV54_06300 [Clostridia bacterium]|nr:hypothetical protein [Clostridia bacterium]